ncbi:death-inducer obliterator 1, partial [Exaiptasia diaphana]|uniref:PHD-type domain-containing protein n=1 Tax=Exaiptasia diaphana TaxID=2652724 RepID=A0A913XN51_EXADI
MEEEDSDYDPEYDPERLWCICRKPHGNRFMICCDSCEEWLHGDCVSITKEIGKEMEKNGIEYICPRCVIGMCTLLYSMSFYDIIKCSKKPYQTIASEKHS